MHGFQDVIKPSSSGTSISSHPRPNHVHHFLEVLALLYCLLSMVHANYNFCVTFSRCVPLKQFSMLAGLITIGLYRENAIAIESEARDPFGGNVYYVTMQITFPIPEFARKERNLHCDVVHVTTKWVSILVLDHAIAAIQTSR